MPATTRPKSRLPGGRINPAYTAWRKERYLEKQAQEAPPAIAEAPGEPEAPAPVIVPEVMLLFVLKLARNSNFVLCGLDGVSVPVRVKRGVGQKLIKKEIRVERRDDGTFHHLP